MDITQLHDILYDILCTVDDICQQENINYMLCGGTLLGAIRHKGFIPWDDDVDICIWRKDYPALKEALQKHLPEYYQLVEPTELFPGFYDFVIRVQDTRYHWHTPTDADLKYNNLQNYICVDIFTFVNSSDNAFGQKVLGCVYRLIYSLAIGHRYTHGGLKHSFAEKLLISIMSGIGKLFPIKTIYNMYDRLSTRLDKKDRKYAIAINDIPKGYGRLYESSWVNNITKTLFRDRMFPVPKQYHENLTMLYGDYMKPPKDHSTYVQHMVFESNE